MDIESDMERVGESSEQEQRPTQVVENRSASQTLFIDQTSGDNELQILSHGIDSRIPDTMKPGLELFENKLDIAAGSLGSMVKFSNLTIQETTSCRQLDGPGSSVNVNIV